MQKIKTPKVNFNQLISILLRATCSYQPTTYLAQPRDHAACSLLDLE